MKPWDYCIAIKDGDGWLAGLVRHDSDLHPIEQMLTKHHNTLDKAYNLVSLGAIGFVGEVAEFATSTSKTWYMMCFKDKLVPMDSPILSTNAWPMDTSEALLDFAYANGCISLHWFDDHWHKLTL